MNLVPLFEEALEFQDYNGTVLSDGKVAVYYIGRTRLADIYEDVAAEYPAENPRILNNLGMGPVYVNPAFDYEMVVFDAYGSELFSVKKYLASKGEHSTANVVVTPSESIAVSAWTVGDVQVYMPYLTGQLGKVYTGIDPIVVNNVEDKISANHVPLGVQDPLYFVQDDEEGCIIGLSGGIVPEGTMNESAFGYQDGQITGYNGSAFSAGNTYEEGSYIDIDGNTISVTGLQPSGEYVTSGDLDEYTKRTDFDVATGTLNSAKLDVDVYSSQSATFLTAHQSLEGYATEQWVENKGYLTAVPDNYATTSDLQIVSGDITALIPSTAGLATENWVTSQGYLTAHQSLDGLMSASLLEQSGGLITGYNGTAFAGQGGGGVTGDYELSAGSGISIVDYPLEQKTVISVTAQGGNQEVEQAVIDNSATWDSVTAKADSTAIPSLDGYATEDWVTAQGYLTGVDLTPYQTTAGMTAYLTTGDSAEFMTTAERSDYIPTGVSSEFYTTANTANYISEVPDTYLQNTDLSTEDGKVTAISGIPLSAGGELPSGVMNTSALEYNAVNEISGYNGSAIAQYGAEKQWLVHDDTLVHAANSAQYALGVNLSAVAQLLGVDETVLYDAASTHGVTGDVNLSETRDNFDHIRIIYRQNDGHNECKDVYNVDPNDNLTLNSFTLFNGFPINKISKYSISGNQITLVDGGEYTVQGWSTTKTIYILQVIGIGRRS